MIFVDANVFMYFVGAEHPLRDKARTFLIEAREKDLPLATSADVLQEILHLYLRTGRSRLSDAAFDLVHATVSEVWPVEHEDVEMARKLPSRHPGLEARDLVHLACCLRREPRRLGRDAFTAWQASERGGLVRVTVRDDRVALSGQAVTVLRGELLAGHQA